ncbi:MAG: hypothetical protein MK160_14805, partial [Rhodobacteraceae bacterium]|nr:hypothetical protein [Paracoccaceae bacterium]
QEERGVLSQSYIAALEVLRVSPFDQNAFATVMEDQSRTARARMIKGQDILISVISDMSDAERSAFADRLERELQKLETRGKAWKRPFKP